MKRSIEVSIKNINGFMESSYKGTGWGYTKNNSCSFVEPSSWCLLFLACFRKEQKLILDGLDWLNSIVNSDGGWPNFEKGPSDIRTANILLLLNSIDIPHLINNKKEQAAKWLINHQKKTFGWSWNKNSWNFTEPTCLATLALITSFNVNMDKKFGSLYTDFVKIANKDDQPRFFKEINLPLVDVRNFLIQLQCQDGGWNSYSPVSLGFPQRGMASVSPWALITLKLLGLENSSPEIQKSLNFLYEKKDDYWDSPYSLGLCLLALEVLDTGKDFQERIVERLLFLQGGDGAWMENILWTAQIGLALMKYQQN